MKVKIVLMAILIFIIPFNINGKPKEQENNQEVKLSDNSNEEARIYLSNIKAEIRRLGKHDWAGEYSFGDGLGMNADLLIAPNSGFLFTWSGCLIREQGFGDLKVENNKIILNYKNVATDWSDWSELLMVKWGDVRFLIPSTRIIDFCNFINSGLDPKELFLVHRKDKNKQLKGKPNIPSEFSSYLLEKPIKGQILEVEENYTEPSEKYPEIPLNITIVRINKGKEDGVLEGMNFRVVDQEFYSHVKIIEVKEHEAKGKILRLIFDLKKTITIPKNGWKVSTSIEFKKNK